MKLNRKTLRRMILNEINLALLGESKVIASDPPIRFPKSDDEIEIGSGLYASEDFDEFELEPEFERENQIDRSIKVPPLSSYSVEDLDKLRNQVSGTHFSDMYDEDVPSIDSFLDDI